MRQQMLFLKILASALFWMKHSLRHLRNVSYQNYWHLDQSILSWNLLKAEWLQILCQNIITLFVDETTNENQDYTSFRQWDENEYQVVNLRINESTKTKQGYFLTEAKIVCFNLSVFLPWGKNFWQGKSRVFRLKWWVL